MSTNLHNILVPVYFSSRDKWAIAKAIELANAFQCNIHLVHVVSSFSVTLREATASRFFMYENTASVTNAGSALQELRDQYREHVCGKGTMEISVLKGNPAEQLTQYIEQFDMDLVVMGLPKFNLLHRILSSVTISKLARQTSVPVLAIQSSGLVSHFKKIVLPVTGEVPIRRIKMATMLARSFKSTIYLVGLRGDENIGGQILNSTLDVLQSISTIPVQCFWLEGKNLAKSTLDFSKRINADLIMANPLTEFQMPGWWSRVTRKLLSYGSTIPVITVDKKNETPS
ncbi:MAG: universal stress protein [Chitinophagaceae bacterium]|nr:universal stress protein [Chitinophagaceae bacterium]